MNRVNPATAIPMILPKFFSGTPATNIRMKAIKKMIAVVEKSAGRMKINVAAMAPSGQYKLLKGSRSRGFENHRANQTGNANEAKADVWKVKPSTGMRTQREALAPPISVPCASVTMSMRIAKGRMATESLPMILKFNRCTAYIKTPPSTRWIKCLVKNLNVLPPPNLYASELLAL